MSRIAEVVRASPRILFLMFPVFLLQLGCSKIDLGFDEPKAVPFEVQINVTSDPGKALPGALIMAGTKVVGKTDAAGSAKVRFTGKEGDQVELMVKCPADYESPTTPLVVSLRRLAAGSRPPRFEARCPPTLRTVVVGVRAENGPNLPVNVLGRTVARTDASGAALFTLRLKPAEQVQVTLGTGRQGGRGRYARRARPSPSSPRDSDDFVVLDQRSSASRRRSVHPGAPEAAKGPTPLMSQ